MSIEQGSGYEPTSEEAHEETGVDSAGNPTKRQDVLEEFKKWEELEEYPDLGVALEKGVPGRGHLLRIRSLEDGSTVGSYGAQWTDTNGEKWIWQVSFEGYQQEAPLDGIRGLGPEKLREALELVREKALDFVRQIVARGAETTKLSE